MKTLSETNPYLQDKELAKRLNVRSTRTSCGVEGIVVKENTPSVKIDHSKSNAVYAKIKKTTTRMKVEPKIIKLILSRGKNFPRAQYTLLRNV